MDHAFSRGGVSPGEVLEYARIVDGIDRERRCLAAFATATEPFPRAGFGDELGRHRDRLFDLTELEELMMVHAGYVDFESHWRAHNRFRGFLRNASSRAELLLCSDWLRQHEGSDDVEFRQWLRHACRPDRDDACADCLYRSHPDRVLLSVKVQLLRCPV